MSSRWAMGQALDLYEADSDEDSSMGGSGIMGQGIDRRDSASDVFSLDSDLLERFDDVELDEHAHLHASAYNPSGLHIGVGTAVNIEGDSDDDGQSVGDDPAYEPLTIGKAKTMKEMGDVDEESIGSDDDFQPAVHSNFPKNKITKSDKDFERQLTANDGSGRADADEDEVDLLRFDDDGDGGGGGGGGAGRGGGGAGGGARGGGGAGRGGRRPSRDREEERRGGGGAGARQPEVLSALARARAQRGRGGERPAEPFADLTEAGVRALEGGGARSGGAGDRARRLLDDLDRASRPNAFSRKGGEEADRKAKEEADKRVAKKKALASQGKVEAVVGGKVIGSRRVVPKGAGAKVSPDEAEALKRVAQQTQADKEAILERRKMEAGARREKLKAEGKAVFRRGIKTEKAIAEMRAEKKEEHEFAKEEAKKVPNTKFFYSTVKVAGKTHLQINHDVLGLLDGKVDKLPLMERALAEAQDEEQTEKVIALIKKLKALIVSTRHKANKVKGVAKKYAERKKAEMSPRAVAPPPPPAKAGGGVVVTTGGGAGAYARGGGGK